jgi:peroxiredoxin
MKTLIALLVASLMLPAAGQFSDRRAPGFSLADSKFRQHDPQDYRGRLVLVDIMLTTCPTCSQLADTLVQINKKYGDKVAIISVVTLPDTFNEADAFAARHGISWPIVFDSGQMIASYMKVTPANPQVHFPHLFVIDGQGMIRNDYEATDEKLLTFDTLSGVIDHLLTPPTKL